MTTAQLFVVTKCGSCTRENYFFDIVSPDAKCHNNL